MQTRNSGFTILELMIVIGIIGILLGMFLPAVRRVREPARRMVCMNNMRQIILSAHNYESQHMHFPPALGLANIDEDVSVHRDSEVLNGMVLLYPFMEQDTLYQQISKPSNINGVDYPAMGPAPWDAIYPPWKAKIFNLQCPEAQDIETGFGITNYAFCVGDQARGIHEFETVRGAFGGNRTLSFGQIGDGSSNTIGFAEMGTSLGRDLSSHFVRNGTIGILEDPNTCLQFVNKPGGLHYADDVILGSPGRGGRLPDGRSGCSIVNTILPPKSPSVAIGSHGTDGIFSAGSFHEGGIVVAMMDGSSRFVSNEIDAGTSTAATPTLEEMEQKVESPYGVWGALGTANASDSVAEEW